jgi:hypothetical protein
MARKHQIAVECRLAEIYSRKGMLAYYFLFAFFTLGPQIVHRYDHRLACCVLVSAKSEQTEEISHAEESQWDRHANCLLRRMFQE